MLTLTLILWKNKIWTNSTLQLREQNLYSSFTGFFKQTTQQLFNLGSLIPLVIYTTRAPLLLQCCTSEISISFLTSAIFTVMSVENFLIWMVWWSGWETDRQIVQSGPAWGQSVQNTLHIFRWMVHEKKKRVVSRESIHSGVKPLSINPNINDLNKEQ